MSRNGSLALLDTGVHIRGWLDRAWWARTEPVLRPYILRASSVVLSELRRGSTSARARRRVAQLLRASAEVWAPTRKDWWAAGAVLAALGEREGFDAHGKRRIQNDVLIALTARRNGACVVTTDRADFEKIGRHIAGLRVVFL
jgi:predicted nucleic acid-binding protein